MELSGPLHALFQYLPSSPVVPFPGESGNETSLLTTIVTLGNHFLQVQSHCLKKKKRKKKKEKKQECIVQSRVEIEDDSTAYLNATFGVLCH